MIKGWNFALDTQDYLPKFLASLMKQNLKTPVTSWEKMVTYDNQGQPFEVEGEYRSVNFPVAQCSSLGHAGIRRCWVVVLSPSHLCPYRIR
jgi:hypothetical protein